MARIIAIDYGAKRTGLAWTDPMQLIASGVGSFATEEIMEKLQSLVQSEEIEAMVLGYPSKGDGSDTHASPLVREFAEELDKQFPEMPIYLWDERFSSRDARRAMLEGGLSKKKRRDKHLVNQVAATLILQDFMNSV